MCQLSKRVVLIHELWQLGRSEEFLHCCCYRLNVDQGLWWNTILILCCHSLTNNSFQSGQTDSVLVLKKFSYRTDTSVTQMVDIIIISHAILKMHVVVDRCKNIFFCDVLRNQIMKISLNQSLHLIYITCRFFNDSCKNRIIYLLCHANLGRININNSLEVNHHIGKNLDISGSLFTLYPDVRYCRILDHISDLTSNLCSLFGNNFTCDRTYSILSEDLSWYTVLKKKLLIKLITSNFGKIITSWIKEHACNQAFCTVYCQRLARTDLLIEL